MSARLEGGAGEALVVVILVAANLLQTFVVPQPAQLVTGPAFAIAAVAVALASGLSWSELGLGRDAAATGLRYGLVVVALVAAAITLVCLVPAGREHFVDATVGAQSLGHVLYEALVRIPIATAGPEEVLFRGVVLAMAVRRLGLDWGVVVAAVLFGLWHIAPTLKDGDFSSGLAAAGAVVGVIAATFAAAIAFSWLRRRSGSVAAPFLAHWATNGVGLLAVYLVSR